MSSGGAAVGVLNPAGSGAGWISGVAFCGDSAFEVPGSGGAVGAVGAVGSGGSGQYLVASSSHDGGVRIYDRRGGYGAGPIFTLRAHGSKAREEKGLCVAWAGGVIASGGADSHVKTYRLDK